MERTAIIRDCFDLLAGFEQLNRAEQTDVFNAVIDTLGSYPKPMRKTSTRPATSAQIGCYLCVSNVRNACKLATFGQIGNQTALQIVQDNLEKAYSLLVE